MLQKYSELLKKTITNLPKNSKKIAAYERYQIIRNLKNFV